jgi:hypothetical protein
MPEIYSQMLIFNAGLHVEQLVTVRTQEHEQLRPPDRLDHHHLRC